ncbi:MAG TPA: lysylphosphatidylglycerol synthase transmembrane domain-containing protein [Verrucomicrobiae bacterium]|nr:lysylphosphatidylglycerol synthase transmembrane domain-containing protein [Verrucomicrobiae bacterium]
MRLTEKKRQWLVRILCICVSAVALFLLTRRIPPKSLAEVFRSVRSGWLIAAILLYGALFLPASCRWLFAFRLTGNNTTYASATRIALIGHFFYTLLLGAAGGDFAKSALFARWTNCPLPQVLAASSFDRLLGFGGLLLLGGTTFAIAAANGGFAGLGSFSIHWRWWWLAVGIVLAILLALALTKGARSRIGARWVKAFVISGKNLIRSPRTFWIGLGCSFAVQFALSGVLALNLEAVSHTPVPWLRLLWTFPVISVISALPITVAGIGVRDSAALALLGLCHIPAADAIAASLLTATASLLWTAIGGLIFWRESARNAGSFRSAEISAATGAE